MTLSSADDNSLQGTNPNGVNSRYMDLPDVVPGPLNINRNPGSGQPYFNTALFSPNALGTPGNASRRYFYGPGVVQHRPRVAEIRRSIRNKGAAVTA